MTKNAPMNILVLAPYVPFPLSFGGAIRTFHLIRQLTRRHHVHLLAFRDEIRMADPEGVKEHCKTMTIIPKPAAEKRKQQMFSLLCRRSFQLISHHTKTMQKALDRICREQQIDAIVIEFSQMGGFKFPEGVKIVLDEHNIEFDLLERMALSGSPVRKAYNRLEAAKFRREELDIAQRSALTLVTSERDGNLLQQHLPDLRTSVIANGVDCDFFAPRGEKREPDTVVFVGAAHYFPNEDGILWFHHEIEEHIRKAKPNFHFFIVGGRPPASLDVCRSEHVEITGYVDCVRPYMWKSSVFVVPLRIGGGTRFKIVEAMAAGIPVVSTRIGAEGIPVTHGKEILLADTPKEFAEQILRIFDDPELAASLAREGLDLVKRDFDWPVIGDRLNAVLF